MILSPAAEIYRRFKQKQQLIDWYAPLNEKQNEAFLSTHPVQLIEGGNRSGKTETMVAKFVSISMDTHPTIKKEHPLKFRMIATVMREGALGILMNKFKRLMPTIHLKGGNWEKAFKAMENILFCRNGDTFQFMSDSQDIQTHRGDDLDFIGCDEEIKEEVFDESLTRLADRDGMIVMSMTPHSGMTWSYKKLVKASRRDLQVGYFHLDTLSNYKIKNRSSMLRKASLLSDKEFAIRIKGERIVNEGLVYFMVSDKTHVLRQFELPEKTQLFLGVDFGLNNPHAGSLWAVTPEGKMYIVDEYYEEGRTVRENAEAQGKWIASKWGAYNLRWVVCDPNSGAQRNEQTNETNIDVFRKYFWQTYGRKVPVLPADRQKGCLEHRINRLREYLSLGVSGIPELMIFSTCVNTLNEFDEYIWGIRKNPEMNLFERPKDAMNHLMNSCEYIAERKPAFMRYVFEKREMPMLGLQYGNIGR
jgi:phage terminase large subunit-like protein